MSPGCCLYCTVRLPVVTVDSDSGNTQVDANNTVPLKIHSLPVAATFAIFDEYVTTTAATTTTAALVITQPVIHLFNSLFSQTTWVSQYQKGKTSLDLNEARDDGVYGCSGISWTICKQSAPLCRQITTPTPRHSVLI